MNQIKKFFKVNSHAGFFKGLAGFGRALNRFYENRNYDIKSNGELCVIKKISKLNPSVIVDGGANIGKYSLITLQYSPKCKIYAFEPVESTFIELQNKVSAHKNIVPVKKGLFSNNCTKEINLFDSSTHSSVVDIKGLNYRSNSKQMVELICGDDFVEENGIETIDFMKLDLEGSEYEAIKGFQNSFKAGKIKAVQFEYGYINISTKKLLIDFYALFEEYGYMVGKIFPKYVEFRKYDFKYEDFLGPNFIAANKNETELIDSLRKK